MSQRLLTLIAFSMISCSDGGAPGLDTGVDEDARVNELSQEEVVRYGHLWNKVRAAHRESPEPSEPTDVH